MKYSVFRNGDYAKKTLGYTVPGSEQQPPNKSNSNSNVSKYRYDFE